MKDIVLISELDIILLDSRKLGTDDIFFRGLFVDETEEGGGSVKGSQSNS